MEDHQLGLLALLILLGAVIGPIPGLDFVAQMGWIGALVGGVVAYLRWRRDPEGVEWPVVVLRVTLIFVGVATLLQVISVLA